MEKRIFEINVSSSIENVGDDTETTESRASAEMVSDGHATFIRYSESGDGGEVSTVVKIAADGVTVTRHGALESVLVFREGESTDSIYAVGPYRFDATVKTRKIRNALTPDGGSLTLYYDMNVGGAEKSVRMKLTLA